MLITAPISSKGQITLPKVVRQKLRLNSPGEQVGFILDEHSSKVQLTRVETVPADEDYTEEELKKLEKLANKSPKKKFKSMEALIRDLHKI